jgi:mRNA interferase MazF
MEDAEKIQREVLIKFAQWTKLKVRLHMADEINFYFKERELWWASIGLNIGSEQNGKNENFERPVLILKKFNRSLLLAIPSTSKDKVGANYYKFEHEGKKYSLILSQARAISSKRLLRKIRKFSEDDFNNTKERIKRLI